jgi:inorganic phosphate transporter, PiT family
VPNFLPIPEISDHRRVRATTALGGAMSDATINLDLASEASPRPHLDEKPHYVGAIVFLLVLAVGLGFVAFSITSDLGQSGEQNLAIGAFVLLGIALLIALGFEFVNGFHDTANAVATVIYTHSLPPLVAVIWSGAWNFLGVLTSSGAVAFSVVTLLPVELILQVGSGAGYAMIFALLIAAIIWNLGTWALGLPNSSSHALIGSIMGVGIANQLMAVNGVATSGVDWNQAIGVFKALGFSPLIGFVLSFLLLLAMKFVVRSKTLYTAPEGKKPPPGPIRALLVLTCTGVSFFHGSNDGQKGMGLIMLILIGVAPTAYALNRAMPESATPAFIAVSQHAETIFAARGMGLLPTSTAQDLLADALKLRKVDNELTYSAMAAVVGDIADQAKQYGTLGRVPAALVSNSRNEMFMVSEAIRVLQKAGVTFTPAETTSLANYKNALDGATRFIPTWVKVSVALALGLGTMVGWKRIVVTVGEKIGKTHLTYAQGASAEIVAMATIGLADLYGLPVSTTHVLSSGVAGTMSANGSGLQWATIKNMALAWIMTLPAAMLISGSLYVIFRQVF